MNASELSTLSKYNIPVIELLFNNEVLGMVSQWQKLFYGSRFSETNLDKPTNYEALAEAFGVKAYTITRRDEVAPVLKKAIASGKPAFINCLIDRDMNVLRWFRQTVPSRTQFLKWNKEELQYADLRPRIPCFLRAKRSCPPHGSDLRPRRSIRMRRFT